MKKSEIPFGAQFSPNQVNLPRLLHIIHEQAGNRNRITGAIQDEFFAVHAANQRWKLADNTVLALRAYHLLEEDGATPTALAGELLAIADTPAVYDHFARHILLNLRGAELVETLVVMETAGEEINLNTLHKRLEQRGLHVPRGAVHLSSMRLWLAQAGIFEPTATGGQKMYEVNQARLNTLLGIGLDGLNGLGQLNAAQRAFLRALTRIAEPDPLIANKIADLASTLYAVEYNHKELPKAVLFPLQDLGYIELNKSTAGRGAKPYELSRTSKFRQEISEPILHAAAEAGLLPRELFEQPLTQILADLKSPNKHVKGKALELLAIYLTRLIDLDFKGWLVRATDSGGSEVQLAAYDRLIPFNCWQLQCLNTSKVGIDEVATAIGRGILHRPSIMMSVTSGSFSPQARYYASQAMLPGANLLVMLVDADDLVTVSRDSNSIKGILRRESRHSVREQIVMSSLL